MKYWFLASPFSRYGLGLEEAFETVARARGQLIRAGVPVFSPVVHSFPVSKYADIDPYSHEIWLLAEAPFRYYAYGIIVLKMVGWENSYGVRFEMEEFETLEKPIVMMEVGYVPEELLNETTSKN